MFARRNLLLSLLAVRFLRGQAEPSTSQILSGQLAPGPSLVSGQRRKISVSGDEPTTKILHDARLSGCIFEVKGRLTSPDRFRIDPIETRPMLLVDGAKRFRVTYYCDVCSIRTYSPGPCMCCQAETRLDLVDPLFKD